MNNYNGNDVIDFLLKGAIIYMEDANAFEKRLYRYNNLLKQVEYTDNYIDWKVSNMNLNDFLENNWRVFKK